MFWRKLNRVLAVMIMMLRRAVKGHQYISSGLVPDRSLQSLG
ncbi:MAG TPA: hypothetical protein QF700_09595 [Prochlorococcus sp.]|nr:hypothetical protein [Prochlorococcus sp.]